MLSLLPSGLSMATAPSAQPSVTTPAMGVASSSRVRVLPGPDRTRIGTLDVPHMGVGTIAWSPDTPEDVERYGAVARTAIDSGLDFFDTAERYGAKGTALIPAALAAVGLPVEQDYLGGDTEQRLASWAPGSNVATKFAPTPWRGDAASVVENPLLSVSSSSPYFFELVISKVAHSGSAAFIWRRHHVSASLTMSPQP